MYREKKSLANIYRVNVNSRRVLGGGERGGGLGGGGEGGGGLGGGGKGGGGLGGGGPGVIHLLDKL